MLYKKEDISVTPYLMSWLFEERGSILPLSSTVSSQHRRSPNRRILDLKMEQSRSTMKSGLFKKGSSPLGIYSNRRLCCALCCRGLKTQNRSLSPATLSRRWLYSGQGARKEWSRRRESSNPFGESAISLFCGLLLRSSRSSGNYCFFFVARLAISQWLFFW